MFVWAAAAAASSVAVQLDRSANGFICLDRKLIRPKVIVFSVMHLDNGKHDNSVVSDESKELPQCHCHFN